MVAEKEKNVMAKKYIDYVYEHTLYVSLMFIAYNTTFAIRAMWPDFLDDFYADSIQYNSAELALWTMVIIFGVSYLKYKAFAPPIEQEEWESEEE